jgi:hypothetical protein
MSKMYVPYTLLLTEILDEAFLDGAGLFYTTPLPATLQVLLDYRQRLKHLHPPRTLFPFYTSLIHLIVIALSYLRDGIAGGKSLSCGMALRQSYGGRLGSVI